MAAIKASPDTVRFPATAPVIEQIHESPCRGVYAGTIEEHVNSRPWNSFAMRISKA
jgi:hypothetical protein